MPEPTMIMRLKDPLHHGDVFFDIALSEAIRLRDQLDDGIAACQGAQGALFWNPYATTNPLQKKS